MKRPESRLAAGGLLCALSVAMLVSVSLVSCEEMGSTAGRTSDGTAAVTLGAAAAGDGAEAGLGGGGAVGTPPGGASAGPAGSPGADYRIAAIVREPEMRVRVLAAVDRVTIEAAGSRAQGLLVQAGVAGAAFDRARGRLVDGPVTARRSGGEWIVSTGTGAAGTGVGNQESGGVRATDGLAFGVASATDGGDLRVNGAPFPGRFWLVARSDVSDRAFDVIEYVGLESYLPGVVAKEMYAGWPAAAYRVQAVCARTYALHERARALGGSGAGGAGRRSWFDVESTERDQAYVGTTRNKAAADAVRDTRGLVLADGGVLLRAYYSSTCGGRTASAADTWPTGPGFEYNLAGPIQACAREVACQSAPMHRWSVRRERSELVQRLRAFGQRAQLQVRNLADLWAIEPLTVNATGRPSAFKIIEPGGRWYRLSGEQLRLALNQSVARAAADPIAPAAAATTVGYGVAGDSEMVGPSAPAVPALPPDIDRGTRVLSSDVEVNGPRNTPGGAVTIHGRGFGHGVGMCQYCAKGFAERGEDWRVTLLRFYPGAAIVSAY